MGSLKDEMRGFREDHQPHDKTDDGERSGGSDDSAVPEGAQINTSQESTSRGENEPKRHTNASHAEEGGESPTSKDQVLSGEDRDNPDSIQIKDCTQTDATTLTQQPEADETTAHPTNMTICTKSLKNGDADIQREKSKDSSVGPDREKKPEIVTVLVPAATDPSNPLSPDPRSPAPFGQQHMRTQVSLEVVQCRSAATSPMTPPEGVHPFFFPISFGGPGAVGSDTKDAELQVGQQVEFCSVATSPMTPKTPSTTAFPELIGREMVQRGEPVKRSEEQRESDRQESFPVTRSLTEAESEITAALKCATSTELNDGSSSASCTQPQVTVEDSDRQSKQQRMGSMDQDITILVTHYGNNGEEDEENNELCSYSIEPEMVKIDEYEELGENKSDGDEKISTEADAPDQDTNPPQSKAAESSAPASEQPITNKKPDSSEGRENKDVRDESATKPPVPESPAPFGCHNICTQVSLEVVQCQSAATSPMTPPEGDHAFYFPSSIGRCGAVGAETKDAEMQVGRQVEFRSVATAPMTPRTPTTTTFPEVMKEARTEEKIVEEVEVKDEQVEEEVECEEEEKVTEEKKKEAEEEEDQTESINCKEKDEEKCEEPVQEVSWDDKGMTWEVYGAVLEVAVLGSAIQKHLEKQVKKQKPSMPPPPPLNPSALPPSEASQGGSGSGSGKGRAGKRGDRDGKVSRRRRNPFRQLMENMHQPHCCSRAHTTE
ncbi:G protein-regulated inducer of neurite outgrowth 1 [Hippoglossus hippoglossus]|uniref:G protein-regulated inducer of neurite outgrowth 1 n=1 Tax=Hippoglossus hippoglossus TaxID=8267 RepID=UPI00148DCD18|nr:G protein-regulated inducer of neurite outgrowth 1 [Hippoglossus hippoglossus]